MERQEIYSILERDYFGPNAIEAEELRLIEPYLEEADLFVDLGASLGQYTKFASEKMRPGATIISVEADQVRYDRLLHVSADWATASKRHIEPIHAAIMDRVGKVSFSCHRQQCERSSCAHCRARRCLAHGGGSVHDA